MEIEARLTGKITGRATRGRNPNLLARIVRATRPDLAHRQSRESAHRGTQRMLVIQSRGIRHLGRVRQLIARIGGDTADGNTLIELRLPERGAYADAQPSQRAVAERQL